MQQLAKRRTNARLHLCRVYDISALGAITRENTLFFSVLDCGACFRAVPPGLLFRATYPRELRRRLGSAVRSDRPGADTALTASMIQAFLVREAAKRKVREWERRRR